MNGAIGPRVSTEIPISRHFMDEYMSALFLPHTNIDAFPTIKKEMAKRGRLV